MKTKHKNTAYLFFLSLILCLSSLFSSLKTYAQHEDLLDKTWYLYKLEIDEEEYEYYNLDIVSDNNKSQIEIVNDSYEEFTTSILFDGCPGWEILLYIEFIENENKFVIKDGGAVFPFEYCQYGYYDEEYAVIEDYFSLFYQLDSIIEYNFITIDAIKYLIFTDKNNDKLYYSAENLSTPDFEILNSSIYPNPVQDQLFIRLEDFSTAVNIKIYDLQGRLIEDFETDQKETPLDVSNYHPGMYFIKLTNSSNQQKTMKFIKQ